MSTERNLLFGVVALQQGAVDAGDLAETCANWADEPTRTIADMMVDRGLMTVEQRETIEATVAQELASHGEDAQATLAATVDARSIETLGRVATMAGLTTAFAPSIAATGSIPTVAADEARSVPSIPPMADQGGHELLGRISQSEAEPRERYTLTQLHAKGGMGRVWLARDGSLGRQIALKELRPEQADNSVVCSRFLYEAKITAQLEHPGIVPVYEMGEGASPYYTMRFVRGKTLTEASRAYHKKRSTGEPDTVGLNDLLIQFVGVCHAIAYAHSRGIIHRDLKGQNVVLGDFGEVIVLDWGLAKRVGRDPLSTQASDSAAIPDAVVVPAFDPNQETCARPSNDGLDSAASDHGPSAGAENDPFDTQATSGAGPEGTVQGQLLGTPAYMAPEQALGRHDLVDQRTDIYGLGAILYEILAGRPPFMATKTAQLIRMVISEAPTPPRAIVPGIAPTLEAVCLKALAKEKADRYQTASELAQEVRRYLADEPVLAYVEPWTMRAQRWARRHRTAVASAAAGLIILAIAGGIGTIVVAGERDEARRQGEKAREAVHLLAQGADLAFDDRLDPVQRAMLQDALKYYEKFTDRAADAPAVRLEHGRAFRQMGDFRRKLGDLDGSEKDYRNALARLEPIAATDIEARRDLARTWTLLGDLLVRRGTDKGKAQPLYDQAEAVQRPLAEAQNARADDRLRLGQTLKSRADLLRLDGRSLDAKAAYDRAVETLEAALKASPADPVVRNELALATDDRGWIKFDLGDLDGSEKDYRRAIGLLEKLVAEFPTVARHREILAKSYNSLGVLEEQTGRLADAEAHYRRELPMVERLAQDYPGRPEHRREVARTLYNLGNVLSRKHDPDAKSTLTRAVEVNAAVAAETPDDVPIRFSLAKAHQCLSDVQFQQGELPAAVASIDRARAITEKLVNDFPDRPRYSDLLAMELCELGMVRSALGKPAEARDLFDKAAAIYERLIAADPANVPYRVGRARCFQGRGAIEATAGRAGTAEEQYRKALAVLEPIGAGKPDASTSTAHRHRATILINLGALGRPGAVEALERSIAIDRALLQADPSSREDRHALALAENNLADALVNSGKVAEAGAPMAAAVATLDRLVSDAPRAVDYRAQYAEILDTHAHWLDRTGRTNEAELALEKAVEQDREAVRLARGFPPFRQQMGRHLGALADVEAKLGDYEKAARTAQEIPRAVPEKDRPRASLDAAKQIARILSRSADDPKLARADRDRLTRKNLGRTVVLLREAIEALPELGASIKDDPDLKPLRDRPEFLALLDAMVDRGP